MEESAAYKNIMESVGNIFGKLSEEEQKALGAKYPWLLPKKAKSMEEYVRETNALYKVASGEARRLSEVQVQLRNRADSLRLQLERVEEEHKRTAVLFEQAKAKCDKVHEQIQTMEISRSVGNHASGSTEQQGFGYTGADMDTDEFEPPTPEEQALQEKVMEGLSTEKRKEMGAWMEVCSKKRQKGSRGTQGNIQAAASSMGKELAGAATAPGV